MDKSKVLDRGASFIKVIGSDFNEQLQIPHDFTKTFGGYVPHRFFIESSMTKKCWRVEVENDGGDAVYLRDGWAAFAEAHDLEAGNFLLFQYEEQSIFQVKVYGRNGCQKNISVDAESQLDMEEERIDEALESEPKTFRRCRQQNARRLSAQKCKNGINRKQRAAFMNRQRSVTVGKNRTSFSVILAKKYQFFAQTIPMAVSKAKRLASKAELVLQDAEGNSWPVKLVHKKTGHVMMVKGWKNFLDGHNFDFGDVLNFEFVSDKLAQVHAARGSESVGHLNEAKYQSEDAGTFQTDGEFGSPPSTYNTKDQVGEASITTKRADDEHSSSSFSFLWTKGRTFVYLYLPKAIAVEQKLMNKETVRLRDTEGKCWPVEVKTLGDGRVALARGWRDFWKGVAIKQGDTVELEFVSRYEIQVNIHRLDPPQETGSEDVPIDLKVMDINGTASDVLAPKDEHCLIQAPPGFKPEDRFIL